MLTIRRYHPADLGTIMDLHVRVLQQVGAYLGPGPWDHDLVDIEQSYIASGGEFLVGEVAGQVVAMGALLPTGPHEGEIKRMRVEPDQQGHGYGRAMLVALEAFARPHDFWRLHLDTSSVQAAALRLYQSQGYIETHREPRHNLELIFHEKRLDLVLRPFTPGDQHAVQMLILSGLGDHWGTIDDTLNPDLRDIMASYVEQGHTVLLAERGGVLAATATLKHVAPAVGQLVRMSVRRDLRRLGIGRHMVWQVLHRARLDGLTRVELETTRTWDDAIGLYRACGFAQVAADDQSVYMARTL